MSFSQTILVGNLGKDPELKQTSGGTSVANLSVATEDSYKNKDGEWVKSLEWSSVVVWGAAGEAAAENLKKGSRVCIIGANKTRSWEDNGEKRYKTDVVATKVIYLDRSEKKQETRPAPSNQTRSSSKSKASQPEFDDSDIPF
jgi:single-strand DNA-binding protein